MGTTRKFTVRTMAVAALIGAFGAFGATGTAMASADTVVDLDPKNNAGAYCTVIDDDGSVETLYSNLECTVAQSDIESEQRAEDRREARRTSK